MTQTTVTIAPKALNVINLLNNAIAKSPTGVSFLSIKNYESGKNDPKVITTKIADYVVNIGASYERAKMNDIKTLRNLDLVAMTAAGKFKSPITSLEQARTELIEAFIKPDANRSAGQINAYTQIANGLKVHNENGFLYIYGYKLSENVHRKADRKPTNSRPLTIAKDELRKLLRTNKFTQFSIEVGNTLKMAGTTLEL
jgi:hypothetical protein